MTNIYYEQNLTSFDFEKLQKKNKITVSVSTALFGVGILLIMCCFFAIGVEGAVIIIISLICSSIPFFGASILLNRIAKKRLTEYDYVISDTTLSVSAVYARSQRKLLYKIESPQIISVGKFGSDACVRAEKSATHRKVAVVNFNDEDAISYILYNSDKDGKKVLLFIEPSKELIINLRRSISRYEVFDESVASLHYFEVHDDMQNHDEEVETSNAQEEGESVENSETTESDSKVSSIAEDKNIGTEM